MKKLFVCSVLFGLALSCLYSQVSVDPSDDFYCLAYSWKSRGVITQLPPMRPYPVQNIKDILDQVLENGTESDREYAASVYERMTGKKLYAYLDVDGMMKYESEKKNGNKENDFGKNVYICPGIEGDLSLFDGTDMASMGYEIGMTIAPDPERDFMPENSFPSHDAIYDPAKFGPCTMYLDVNTAVAYGSKDLFFQGGMYRSGYGNYLGQGIVLNDNRFHSTNMSLTWLKGRLSYTQMISMLGATSSYDGNIGSLDSGKLLGFDSISYDVNEWFDFSFFETVIIGNRFDICTVLPVPYMISQELTGAGDGVFMGLTFNVKPFKGLSWASEIMVDDFDVDEFFKFNFDAKYRVAARTGFIWTPEQSFFSKVILDYVFVTPYTYSHWEYDRNSNNAVIKPGIRNYQNYTNNGIKIGSQYEPNSDAIELSFDIRPTSKLKFNVRTSLSRHANICESLTEAEALEYLKAEAGTYATDGSIYTHSMFSNPDGQLGKHVDTAWTHLNFLNQDHIMTTFHFGTDAEYELYKNERGSMVSLKAGFDFEYIHNYGVGNEMFPGGTGQSVESARKAWEDGLCDKTNLYFNCGVSIRY